MRKIFLLILTTTPVAFEVLAQDLDQKIILKILADQTIAWNKGDVDGFMKGYWNNDSMLFVGKNTVTQGYQNTLTHYRETFNNADKRGKLFFDIIKVKKISNDYFFVLGKWFLKRKLGDTEGLYTLLFRKINGKWVIISDHSS